MLINKITQRLISLFMLVGLSIFGLVALMPQTAQAAVNCSDTDWTVINATELNEAIVCFNAKSAGSYSITLSQHLTLTASSTAINNSTANTDLTIDGATFRVNGNNNANVRPFEISGSTVVTMANITVMGGNVTGNGGGILNEGTLNIINSTIKDNAATSNGGGIANDNNVGLSIIHTTINHNTAGSNGGGVYSNFPINPVEVANSTISHNSAASGGGIFADFTALALRSTTIYSNTASTVNGGGGVYSNDQLTVDNSIIAKSTNADCFSDSAGGGSIVKVGTNIVEDDTCTFTGGSDPLVGPLQDNGGDTFTHALLTGSPAIDAGATDLSIDQRGNSRPQGAADDIGAYELAAQVALTVTKEGTGSGSVSSLPSAINCGVTCTQSFDANTIVTLTASADADSSFTGWSGDATGSTNPITLTLDAAKNVTATFDLNSYALTTATDGTGSGSITKLPDAANYDHGTVVTLTATADSGSTFAGWSGDATGSTNPITITMDAAKSITATFDLEGTDRYTVTLASDGTGAGTLTKSPDLTTYESGSVITLTATADSGSSFTGWSGSIISSTNPITLTVDGEKTITGTFTLDPLIQLSAQKDGTGQGVVSSSPAGVDCGITCTAEFAANTIVTLTATADTGSTFSGWQGSGCSGIADCAITLDASKSVTATFTLGENVLSVSKDGTGSGTVTSSPAGIDCGSTCGFDFTANTVVTLTATADSGSTFTGWSGEGCSGTDVCVVTVDGAGFVSAMFAAEPNNLIYLPIISRP